MARRTPRPYTPRVPKLGFHAPTGRWRARFPDPSRRSGRREVYFGPDATEAQRAYEELVARWLGNGRDLSFLDPAEALPAPAAGEATIDDLALAFLEGVVLKRYVKNGQETSSRPHWRRVIRYWSETCGTVLACRYDLQDHERFRSALIARGLSRTTVVDFLRDAERIVRWCAARKLAPRGLSEELREMDPMPSHVKDPPPVRPVPRAIVEETLAKASPVLRDMARVQELCGMRPGEVCALRASWIDFKPEDLSEELRGQVALARIEGHKTEHRGRERVVVIGPKALAIIRRYLRLGRDLIFVRDVGEIGEPWTTAYYGQRLAEAARLAGVERWGPNRLRHNAASAARKHGGLELAQLIAGHASKVVTERYAELDRSSAIAWAAQHG